MVLGLVCYLYQTDPNLSDVTISENKPKTVPNRSDIHFVPDKILDLSKRLLPRIYAFMIHVVWNIGIQVLIEIWKHLKYGLGFMSNAMFVCKKF